MNRHIRNATLFIALIFTTVQLTVLHASAQTSWPTPQLGDFTIHNFHFQSGETLPEVRMHYTTLGKPMKDASGHTTNAVLVLHGTGGGGSGLLRPIFAGVLFGQ